MLVDMMVRPTCPGIFGGCETYAGFDPYSPRSQTVHEQQRKVSDYVATVSLDFPSPSTAAHGSRGGGRRRRRA